MKKKIVYISGSRADYSLMRRTLINLNKLTNLTIIVTSMHLNHEFGFTINEIEKEGLKIKRVDTFISGDNLKSMAESFFVEGNKMLRVIKEINPNLIFIEGDRGEALNGAIIGAYFNIPVVHQGGGDMSGSIDNKIRNAITMFANYHLVGNENSYQRLLKIGIPKKLIFKVGEPGLDDIYAKDFTPKEEIAKKYKLNLEKPILILIQHPNTEEYHNVSKQIKEILEAIKTLKFQTVAVFSNSDAGGKAINKALKEYAKRLSYLQVYPNITRKDFLGLMNVCDAMVGNSSAGIIELPSFKKPFICVGTRQKNRIKANNVINVGYNTNEIVKATNKAIYNTKFKEKIAKIKNPYGDGQASIRIVKIISKILNGKL